MSIHSADITTCSEDAARIIRNGGLVGLPTETVYGLGADATNAEAVARIFAAKQRPAFDPLIVHLPDHSRLPAVARDIPNLAWKLAEKFWPGPLTLVLPKQPEIPDIVTSGLASVGVRVPRHPAMRQVLELAAVPIAAPSANLFGRLSPTTAAHVASQLGLVIDLILDGGPCEIGLESTIVRVDPNVDGDVATVLRLGGLSLEDLRTVAPRIRLAASESPTHPEAPGMLPQHYAPRTRLEIFQHHCPPPERNQRCGLLTLREADSRNFALARALTTDGNLVTAAARFFEALHELDHGRLDLIYAEEFPEVGLGRALNDRLRRAAATHPPAGPG